MWDIAILFVHLLVTVLKLIRPGGTRSVIAESLLLKHQLLILNRSRQRAPNLKFIDRVIAGMCVGLVRPARLFRSAIVLKPSTLMSVSSVTGATQISVALFPEASPEAWPERSIR